MKVSVLLFLVAILSIPTSAANAQTPASRQDDTLINGTITVTFAPAQVGGVLQGCTLVYQAVVADTASRGGELVVVVGNIGVHRQDKSVFFALKLGVKDFIGNSKFEAPHFAYLQGTTATSAKSRYVANPSDEGFQLFLFTPDDQSIAVILEAIETRKVTVGFNRRENGLDLLFPIDLTVAKAVVSGDTVVRTRSESQMKEFAQCFTKLTRGN